jgi:hypothetical protein
MGLGIDLTLLAIKAEPGYLRVEPALPYSLVVAELVDLAAAGRITLHGELIEVLDRSGIGDALADDSLARLAAVGHGLSVEQWLKQRSRWRVEAYLAGLREDRVLSESSAEVVGAGRIEIADTLRAAAPVHRLLELIVQERDALSVQDLAFVVLAGSTGWPQAHLQLSAHRELRAGLRHLTASVTASADVEGYEGDAAFAVLRLGVWTAVELARQSLVSGEHNADYGSGPTRSTEQGSVAIKRGWRLVTDVVALLALATLVLACLTNVDLAIIIAPFTIVLIGLPIAWRVEFHAHRRRRKTAKRGGDKPDVA